MRSELAKEYAINYHTGQYRKCGVLPYIVHSENTIKLLGSVGVHDDETLAIGWLHDTLEDTSMSFEELVRVFGQDIAEGVYILTRNVDREEYKRRLHSSPRNVQFVKLCDTLDNVRTLECLSQKGIGRKFEDCISFYIPLALEICPLIAEMMTQCLLRYLRQHQGDDMDKIYNPFVANFRNDRKDD